MVYLFYNYCIINIFYNIIMVLIVVEKEKKYLVWRKWP